MTLTNQEVKLSPSKLSYEDRRCDRCFGLELAGEKWPSGPFPGLFSALDRQQRAYFEEKSTQAFDQSLPSGTIHDGGRVKSAPYTVDGIDFVISGSMDALIRFDDGTVGVVDYKSSSTKGLGEAYRPQLAAYGWALSHPAKGDPEQVSLYGLVALAPTEMTDTEKGRSYLVSTTWYPYDIEDRWMEDLFKRLAPIVKNPHNAQSKDGCEWCDLRVRLTN